MNHWATAAIGVICAALCAAAQAQQVPGCGRLENAYGPFDYRDPIARRDHLNIVERAHFTSNVEQLVRGATGVRVIGDIDYTLRAWPNHPRALAAVGRYGLRGDGSWANPDVKSADCYFERAIAFRPDDEVVRMLYGNYLAKRGKRAEAHAQYERALALAPNEPEINYNAGLFFVDEGDLDRAKKLAQVAYDGGYPLPGLRKKIAAAEKQRAK